MITANKRQRKKSPDDNNVTIDKDPTNLWRPNNGSSTYRGIPVVPRCFISLGIQTDDIGPSSS